MIEKEGNEPMTTKIIIFLVLEIEWLGLLWIYLI